MIAYYNEIDPYCAAWLRNLIDDDQIPFGVVDERDIRDVHPHELYEYSQCHFFAGLGGWPLALRMAGWDDDRPVWTGSCPCQPFSAAGRRLGFADERDLWPSWFHIIRECRPAIVFGEQVASKDGLVWLDRSRNDMEGAHYAFGCADLPACGVEAPQKRSRLFFVAHGDEGRSAAACASCGSVGSAFCTGSQVAAGERRDACEKQSAAERAGRGGAVACACMPQGQRQQLCRSGEGGSTLGERAYNQSGRHRYDAWGDAEWLFDHSKGVHRRVKPGVRLLAHGIPARVAKLRALGNAIVPQVAAEFIIASGLA